MRLRKYGVEATIDFTLYEVDGVNLRTDWTPAQADCEIMKDGGASTMCTNTATDEGSTYSIVLTATEMEAARLVLKIVDAATKVFLDHTVVIETYGNAAAQHAMDLDSVVPTYDQLEGFVQLMCRSDTAIGVDRSTLLAAINFDEGSGIGDYSPANDSQEALFDALPGNFTALAISAGGAITYVTDLQDGGRIDLILDGITTEVNEIHTAVHNITITGSALNVIAEAPTVAQPATGTESSGTWASTNLHDDVYHIITAATNEIDIYYQFPVPTTGAPVSVNFTGYLREGVPAGGDTIDAYAYNFVSPGWDKITDAVFTGIATAGPAEEVSIVLFARHASAGVCRIRFQATSLEATTTLNIDQIYVSYAETVAASVALILADTNELQGDWKNTGRLDTILDTIATNADTTISSRATATDQSQMAIVLADVPNTAEFEARTIVAADYSTASALATHDGKLDTAQTSLDAIPTTAMRGTENAAVAGDAMTLTAGERTTTADIILARDVTNVEDSAAKHSLGATIMIGTNSSIATTTLTAKKISDDSTFNTYTVTVSASADPITGIS